MHASCGPVAPLSDRCEECRQNAAKNGGDGEKAAGGATWFMDINKKKKKKKKGNKRATEEGLQ